MECRSGGWGRHESDVAASPQMFVYRSEGIVVYAEEGREAAILQIAGDVRQAG